MQRLSIYIALASVAGALTACNGATGRAPDLSSQVLAESSAAQTTAAPKTTVQKLNYTFGPFRLDAGAAATPMTGKEGKLSFHVDSPEA